ncbi:MAG TPA: ABC transporter permease [Acidimicrobiales bacterium]|nr:ABC transporter permease [Acidimicrobiales bacterium]
MTAPLLDATQPPNEPAAVAPTPPVAGPAQLRFPGVGWVGLALVGAFVVLALVAPLLTPYRVTELAGDPIEPPSRHHLLGTNVVGQDVATQVAAGARVSLLVAFVAGGGTLVLGAVVGLVAGWFGGWVDAVLLRVVDVVLVIPKLPLLIVAGAYAGTSLTAIVTIIALTSWPPTARVLRSQVLSVRRRAHLKAAFGFGASALHMLRRHVVPEIGLVLAAAMVSAAGRAVMLEAGLAFLGLGDPIRASWGSIMRDALRFGSLFFTDAWQWWLVPPVAAVSLLLLGITFVGLGVEQRVNPRLARHGGSR